MLVFFGAITIVLAISMSLSKVSKLPTSYYFPISIFLAVIFTTIFGLFDKLLLGAVLLLPISIFILFYLLGNELIKKPREFLKNYLNFPVLIFVIMAYFTFRQSRQMQFYEWDEFTHWGPAVKSMYLFNALGYDTPVSLNNPNYPPGLSIFSYLIARLEGQWNEANVFWAYQLIFVSIVSTLISKLKFRDFFYSVIILISALLGTLFFYNILQSVYADPLLSVIFGYTLVLAAQQEQKIKTWLNFNFLVSLTMLVLVKDFGIVLALISIVVFMASQTINMVSNKAYSLKEISKSLIVVLISIFVAFGTRFVWGLYTTSGDLKTSSNSALANSPSYFSVLFNDYDFRAQTLLNNFIQKFFNAPVSFVGGVPLTTSRWIMLLALFFAIYIFSIRKNKLYANSESIKIFLILLGSFVYLFALYLAYLTVYSGDYALSLPSFERYVNTYLSGTMFFLISKSAEQISLICEDKNKIYSISNKFDSFRLPSVTLIILIFTAIYSPSGYLFNYLLRPYQQAEAIRGNFQGIKQKIDFANFNTQDRVGIIAQHTVGFEYYVLQYEIMPASTIQTGFYTWSIGSPSGPDDVWTDTTITPERWNEYLNSLNYVIIYNVTDSFMREFGSFFEEPESAFEQGIYRVVSTDGKNRLVKFI